MFWSDRPIQGAHEDALHRTVFSQNLAKAITNYPSSDGLVIGLYGPWGSGKTSVLNLVKDYLRSKTAPNATLILEFSPWLISEREALIATLWDSCGYGKCYEQMPLMRTFSCLNASHKNDRLIQNERRWSCASPNPEMKLWVLDCA